MNPALTGLNHKRLMLWLTLFFVVLSIPAALLIYQAHRQLKWESFHQHRVLAEELAARIDERLILLFNEEESRTFADYAFLVVAGDPSANFLQRSPLSAYPVASTIPGLLGYFQIDARGAFSSPLLPAAGTSPAAYGISAAETEQRRQLQNRLLQILSDNRLEYGGKGAVRRQVAGEALELQDQAAPLTSSAASSMERDDAGLAAAPQVLSQARFDQLDESADQRAAKDEARGGLGRVEDLKLDRLYQYKPEQEFKKQRAAQAPPAAPKRFARKEQSALPEPQPGALAEKPQTNEEIAELHVRTFESEIDPFELSLLDSAHFVLFRKVWRDGQRYIQGALIEQQPFFKGVVESAFAETALSAMSDLILAYRGDVLSVFTGQTPREQLSGTDSRGALLYRMRLSAPLNHVELIFSLTRLPPGPGATVLRWIAGILLLVLCGGCYLLYRLGAKQIDLTLQQQDFVSAVSHELKTPLTSIRMYGEILREGWADEEKKRTYYDYIYYESERLSRLINNVLQLARMTRNDANVELKPTNVAQLLDGIRSKVSSQMERAGFVLNLECSAGAAPAVISVDEDNFFQIIINLVDNAIKFSAKAKQKRIDIACAVQSDNTVVFSVRDYGPGIAKGQMKKIFKLFYRPENEFTRETAGTGIGLALVRQLVRAMHGKVDVANKEPGAEFVLSFPALDAGRA